VKKGVNAFLPKNYKIEKVVDAIYKVYEEGAYFDSHVSMIMAKELSESKEGINSTEINENELTEKEKTIIRYICQNKTSEEIAKLLNLSKKTIDYHRSKIMDKTHSSSIASLITFAVQKKLISIQ
jgi:DNA-binding NarL/FixJ family response regulator